MVLPACPTGYLAAENLTGKMAKFANSELLIWLTVGSALGPVSLCDREVAAIGHSARHFLRADDPPTDPRPDREARGC
jgi:hypothetical protein